MNYKMISRTLGMIFLIYAILMLLPVMVGLLYGDHIHNFLISLGIGGIIGGFLFLQKPSGNELVARDGFVIVGVGWIGISLLGALPFRISGSIPRFVDAFFETVSGLSTTGATIVTDFAGMPHCDMFWRLFNHWIGGMGVLVFIMAVLPMSGAHSMHIMRAEVPGPSVGKLVPRVKRTARILYLIYIGLTIVETLALMICGMRFYDALLHSFSTAGTGGFSTLPDSIAGFGSVTVETVITVFMLLFGVNFNIYYLILIRSFRKAFKNEELAVYIIVVCSAALMIAAGLTRSGMFRFPEAIHQAFFNVATIISTTGFGTVDFTLWPEYCKWILVLLMFCGACAGSTGGGIKLSRLIILFKALRAELVRMIRPRNIYRVQLDQHRVDTETIRAASVFVVFYFILIIVFSVLISFDGLDLATCFTASLSCISNIGPGMTRLIGPAGNFTVFSDRSKLLLSVAMLIGRLEIYPILALFSPRTWRR